MKLKILLTVCRFKAPGKQRACLGFAALSILLFFAAGEINPCRADAPPRVLLVQSGNPDSPWTQEITRGVKDALRAAGCVLEAFYLDEYRNSRLDQLEAAGQAAGRKIRDFRPAVVVAAGDAAQVFVTQNYAGGSLPFIYCAVNGDISRYGLPAANVTGVWGRPRFRESLALLKRIDPGITTVAVISDDSPETLGAYDGMTREDPGGIKVLGYHVVNDFDLWQERVQYYNRHADAIVVYNYHTLRQDGEEKNANPQSVLRWTMDHAEIPLIGFFDPAVRGGMLCGVGESGYEHGLEAGKMAAEVLRGTPVKDLPAQRMRRAGAMVNLTTAQKFGIVVPEEELRSVEWIFK